MRILITGGSGFVGNQLARRLLVDGHSVSLILRSGFRSWRMSDIIDHVKIQEGDLADTEFVRRAVTNVSPDWIFSSAAYGAYSSEKNVSQMATTNVVGLHNLLQAAVAANCASFVNVASCFEYGEQETAPPETATCAPSTDYGISRLMGTKLCDDIARRTGLSVTTLRLYSTYGPFEDPRRLITRLCLTGVTNNWPEVNPETAAHDYTYIDDVVDALVKAARLQCGKTLNVGSGTALSVEEVVALVATVIGVAPPVLAPSEPNTQHTWIANTEQIESELAWRPKVGMQEGLYRTVSWLEENAQLALDRE